MRFDQEGDAEGIFVFGPGDPMQAKLAIKSVQAKAKRKMALVSLARLGKVGSNSRKHTAEGRFSS
jgi:ribosomal protein S5